MQRIFLAIFSALAVSILAVFSAVLAVPVAQAADAATQKVPLGWTVKCYPLPSREVDPIVYPGKVGLSHLHDPFGQDLDPYMVRSWTTAALTGCPPSTTRQALRWLRNKLTSTTM